MDFDAKEHKYPPKQKLQELADGAILVKFSVDGKREMSWRLFRWSDVVSVIEPKNGMN